MKWGGGAGAEGIGGVGGGGAREGMLFSQSKNARLLNFFHAKFTSIKFDEINLLPF